MESPEKSEGLITVTGIYAKDWADRLSRCIAAKAKADTILSEHIRTRPKFTISGVYEIEMTDTGGLNIPQLCQPLDANEVEDLVCWLERMYRPHE